MIHLDWKKTTLDKLENIEENGVYILTINNIAFDYPFYAGESHTNNISKRIKDHFLDSEENEKLNKTISDNGEYSVDIYYELLPYFTEDEIKRVEKYLIHQIKINNSANCNIEENPTESEPIRCNLPNFNKC